MHYSNYSVSTEEELEGPYRSGRSSTQQLELMQYKTESGLRNDPERRPFTSIDDLAQKAEELASGLRQLGQYKHPLMIRKGSRRKGVKDMQERAESRVIKAGSKTYFFDLKETREGKPYLVITESRFKGEGEERERVSIAVFPENAEEFSQAVAEMAAKLA
ncbi:MAG: DUF3276 family protein [Candidatus Promineifilaceae bacterium]